MCIQQNTTMPCFAMLSSCSMLISCSEHCYLMLFSAMSSNFTKSVKLISFAFLPWNLLWCDLAVAQCSSFVKHLLQITAICFVAMLGCCSIVTCCILSSILLFIADQCHTCFACHLQTVHPIPVIFTSISTEIISSFQLHTWFAKLMPCSSFPFWSTHMHCISHLAYHAMYCIMLLVHSRD